VSRWSFSRAKVRGVAAVAFQRDGDRENPQAMFVFFSSRLGCLGSLAVSAAITLILLLILGVL
jgi:hypothetical protein